jgi:ElaB/YqjD/DUF883 family membrane-anchored ribosome-binding protein
MEHKSNENISAALKLLEDAAKQKKDELKMVLSDKYTNLRSLIIETDSSLMKLLDNAKDHALESADHFKEAGVEKAHEIVRDVDGSVHHNPWPYIAGAAVLGTLLGVLLRRSAK